MLGIAATQQGAMQAAHAIIDAGPRSGAEDLTFFRQKAEQLLWPLLFVAANDAERSMADVVRWLMTQDRPGDSGEGQVIAALDRLFVTGTAECRSEARAAYETLLGRWSIDDRTRSNIYATAQAVLAPWQDPGVIDAGQHTDVDLEWLLDRTPTAGGRAWSNTLYVCAPMQDQQRLAPVFGGLLGDLLNQPTGKPTGAASRSATCSS